MANDRPWAGFGPGVFQFQFVPYQKSWEMTRISVHTPVIERSPATYGRGGGAHSEYLQALAEMGWPGLLGWLALSLFVLRTGLKGLSECCGPRLLWLTMSFFSFIAHAFVNNMLHDGRIAALFWGTAAMIGTVAGSRKTGGTDEGRDI
jgi:O-antigen ligase